MGKRGPIPRYPHQVWVNLSDEQREWLRREAALTGTSMNDLVRDALDRRIRAKGAAKKGKA